MKKCISVSIILLILMFLLNGCINPFLPIYEYEETDEYGITVIIDGVKYVQLPRIKWHVTPTGNVIGYAGSWDGSMLKF